jgi:hypothetical protein
VIGVSPGRALMRALDINVRRVVFAARSAATRAQKKGGSAASATVGRSRGVQGGERDDGVPGRGQDGTSSGIGWNSTGGVDID